MEKTVSVRLKLIHDAYIKAAKEAGSATDNVAKADKWKQLGQATSGLGDTLTRNVTLPIIGVGVAATKMSMDFDKTFVNMQTLAGVAGSEVSKMKDQVLDLAGETGKAPQELAEALYFLRSSGLDASQAMDALEVSAKGSAAGLGSTVQVADAVSSAMNAYAESNLTAAEATDVMIATAREGKVEPAELAAQMGKLLPISSELGISFHDVGAALATLSMPGNDAAASATRLSAVMSKLLKPSLQGAEALAAVGISLDDLQEMVAGGDLLGTLQTLRESLGDAGFRVFLEDSEAIQGALAITGGDVDATRERFDALADSAGATDEAFSVWAESMGAKNAKAWAQFQAALIRLGDTLAPLATDLIGFASKLLEAFDKLPGPAKQLAAGLVIAAAAAGPLLSTGGRLISVYASLSKAFAGGIGGVNAFGQAMNTSEVAAAGLSTKLTGLARVAANMAVVAGATMAASAAMDKLFPIKDTNLSKVENDLVRFAESGKLSGDAAELLGDEFEHLRTATADVFDASNVEKADNFVKYVSSVGGALQDLDLEQADRLFKDLDETLTSLAAKDPDAAAQLFERISDEMKEAGASTDEIKAKFDGYAAVLADADTASRITADTVEETTGAFDEETTAVNEAVTALGEYADALTAQFDPLFGMIDAHKGVRDARIAVDEASRQLIETQKDSEATTEDVAAAERDLADAHDEAVTAALGFEQAQIGLASAVESGAVELADAKAMLQRWVEQNHITQAEADAMAAKFDVAAGSVAGYSTEIDNVPGSTNTDVHVNTVAAREGIKTVHGDLNKLDARSATLDVYVTVHGKSPSELLAGYGGRSNLNVNARALGGPVWRGEGYVVGERGPEWFEPNANGRIIPNHMLSSNLVPHSNLAGGGSAGNVFVSVDMRGAIVSSSADAQRWVANAWNRAAQRNLVSVRGRPL